MSDIDKPSRWWIQLNSDPDPAEAVSIAMKYVVGLSILWRTTAGSETASRPLPGGVISLLGEHAAIIGGLLVIVATIHAGALLHGVLRGRRVCAAISSFWWLFSLYVALVILPWYDTRCGVWAILFLLSSWTSWRLWRPGVKASA